jgi:hypothetical protein
MGTAQKIIAVDQLTFGEEEEKKIPVFLLTVLCLLRRSMRSVPPCREQT